MPAQSTQFEDKDIITFAQFSGMNTQSDRHDLPEDKAAWMENLQPVADNNLLVVPAAAATTATLTGETIVAKFFAPINNKNYMICFCNSGAAYAVDLSNGTKTKFANSATFSTAPDMTVWNLSRILITDATAGYCTWDGTTFVQYGGVSPNLQVTAGGSGYSSGATVAISGGSGSGATATATVVGGVVTALVLTAPGSGYKSTDTLTVTISPVSGGSGATGTAHPWPLLSNNNTTLAVGFGRVWLAFNNILTYTGTGAGAAYGGVGYDDFATGDASGSTTITDADLVHSITALRFINNYLYIIGDNSVKQIGSISVSSNVTNFSWVTLSSDQGTIYKYSIVSYNRLLIFVNTVGVYAVFGSSVEKISDDMDGIFQATDFTTNPSSAVCDVNNIHCLLILLKYKDPAQGNRSIMITYMNKKWFVVAQGNGLRFITTAKVAGITEAFGSSGADLTQLLEDPTTAVNILLKTALTSHGSPYMAKKTYRYAIAQNVSSNNNLTLAVESERVVQSIGYNVYAGLTFIGAGSQPITFTGAGGQAINFFTSSSFNYQTGNTAGVSGIYLGATLSGSVTGFSLNKIMLEFGETAAFGKSTVSISAT